MSRFDLSVYLVLDPELSQPLGMVETARRAVAGGATMVQLRDKHAGTAKLVETGRALKAALAGSGVPLIVNDDAEAAAAIGAEGLHVGQGDLAAQVARQIVGPDMILGLSVESVELALKVDAAVVDYVGVGPVFATATKRDHKQPIGFFGLADVISALPVPAVAIGGLRAEHAAEALAAGAKGIAVVSAICGKDDPAAAAREIALAIGSARA